MIAEEMILSGNYQVDDGDAVRPRSARGREDEDEDEDSVRWVEHRAESIIYPSPCPGAGRRLRGDLASGRLVSRSSSRAFRCSPLRRPPGRPMAQLVTRPVEEALRVFPACRRSPPAEPWRRGNLDRFRLGRDMTAATLQVDTVLSRIMPSLPAGTTSTTRRMEPTVFRSSPMLDVRQGLDPEPARPGQVPDQPLPTSIPARPGRPGR